MTTPVAGAVAPIGGNAIQVREATAVARAATLRQVAALEATQAQVMQTLEDQRRAMEAEFAAKKADLARQLAPMQKELAKLMEVAWTADLYLGRKEDLTLLRDGKPAPFDTPITIRQKVLSMAEESLVLLGCDTNRGLEADNIKAFTDWLMQSPQNLDRVLPEIKGVVVLVPTWVKSRSGNIFEDSYKDAQNQTSWWLLRNGDRLHLLTVDPALRIGKNLLPLRNEFTDIFEQRLFGFGSKVEPGSEQWLALEDKADAARRHYMRVALVLQGVVDRTTVWHPMRPGGVNLMSVDAQEDGRLRIIQDGDESLQLGDGKETFRDWQLRLNKLLRPGLRLVGNWGTSDFQDEAVDWDGHHTYGHHPRIHPTNAEFPESNRPYLIEDRRGAGLVIRFERTDKIWKRDVPVPDQPGFVYTSPTPVQAKQRASLLVKPEDTWVLPYDMVTEAELEYYLNHRGERSKHFLSMVPTVRAALEAKKDEAEQEAPFRVLLAGELIGAGTDPNTTDALVDELVQWWKVANTWARPLNGDPIHERKAVTQIVAEYRARTRNVDASDTMAAAGRSIEGVIAVGCNRQGKWFAYAPSDTDGNENVFLDVTPIRKDGTLGETARWQKLQHRTATALNMAWSAPEWDRWNHAANKNHYLTGPEREDVINWAVDQCSNTTVLCVTELFEPALKLGRIFKVWSWVGADALKDTAVRIANRPLSYHYEHLGCLVSYQTFTVTKSAAGVDVILRPEGRHSDSWGQYSFGHELGDVPWWPADRPCGGRRPHLVRRFEEPLAELGRWLDRCADAYRQKEAEKAARDEQAYRYVRPMTAAIVKVQQDQALVKFVEDFGPDAMDLWPNHLKQLRLTHPIHSRDIWGMVMVALNTGHPIVGQTLDVLADHAFAHNNHAGGEWAQSAGVRVDVKEFGHLVMPEPEPEPVPEVPAVQG